MQVCFLVGSVAISGGTYVIFEHASFLVSKGFCVCLAVQSPFERSTLGWHPAAQSLEIYGIEEASRRKFDLVIATWWKTVLDLPKFNASRYAYFVQSIESRFYADHEVNLRELVNSTYDHPFFFVTESTWIQKHLKDEHGQVAGLVRNGIRKDLYTNTGDRVAPRLKPGRLRVLVEGPFGVPFKNTGRTIKLVRKVKPGELWLLSNSKVSQIPGVDRVFSQVPISGVPPILRSCDLIVKLSYVEGMFGPPLEMFHCGGTAIVYDVTGCDEYIVHNENGLIVVRDDEEGVVESLSRLLEDPVTLERLKSGALTCASRWPSWEESSSEFADWVQKISGLNSSVDQSSLKEKIEESFSKYCNSELQERKSKPWARFSAKGQQILGRFFNRMPESLKARIRQVNYISECYF